jgi:hypothetical protein
MLKKIVCIVTIVLQTINQLRDYSLLKKQFVTNKVMNRRDVMEAW